MSVETASREEVRGTSIQDIRDQEKRKIEVTDEIDSVISEICKKIKKDDFITSRDYAETVKALAQLVTARTLL